MYAAKVGKEVRDGFGGSMKRTAGNAFGNAIGCGCFWGIMVIMVNDNDKGEKINCAPENIKPDERKSRSTRDYFQLGDSPENVARMIMYTKPKRRGERDFEKRDRKYYL